VDVSVNATVSGASPEEGVNVKSAVGGTGGTTVTVIFAEAEVLPPAFVAVNVTVYSPALANE
jgi:hypothetical protein